jgi:hypothetical protein
LSHFSGTANPQLKAHTFCMKLLGRKAQGNHVFPLAVTFEIGQDDLASMICRTGLCEGIFSNADQAG